MNKCYLIQTGMLNNISNAKSMFGTKCENGFIDLDYMGAAEFEWGAEPKSLIRIFDNYSKYHIFYTDFIAASNKHNLILYCNKDCKNDIIHELEDLINHEEAYCTHEPVKMAYHFKKKLSNWEIISAKFEMKTDFWWCIDNTNYGDWMAFLGTKNEAKSFLNIINKMHDTIYPELIKKYKV